MEQLLQQASQALCVHDADTLERLAGEAATCSVPNNMLDVARALEVLRQQVAAAAGHLELQRRLREPWSVTEQPWVR